MASLDDAFESLQSARNHLSRFNYAGAIREAQICVELSIKALLENYDIEYKKTHDIGDGVFKGVFEKAFPHLKDYEIQQFQECLAKSRVYMKLLSSIKNFTTYTFLDVPAKKLFDRDFAKTMIDYASQTYHCCRNLSNKIVM